MHPLRIYQPTPELLAIDWQDGSRSEISSRELRRRCLCSECASKARSESARFIPLTSSVSYEIAELDLVGSSAMHVAWRDGHSRSIYRYDFLRSIAPPRMPDSPGNTEPSHS
ncbi:MAG: DUF971 domain-containing protein [bacterium]|nr:DUF971 domain-containing protein [Candidatus Kapabacteria bacterium]